MIKTILFTATLMTLTLVGFATTNAYACGGKPCTKCAEAQKAPCTKCLKAGKPCKCNKKSQKPCEKTLNKKPYTKALAKKRSEIFFNE